MTGKELFAKLGQEQFDVKGYQIAVEIPDCEDVKIVDVYLDEVNHQIKLVAEGFAEPDAETAGD